MSDKFKGLKRVGKYWALNRAAFKVASRSSNVGPYISEEPIVPVERYVSYWDGKASDPKYLRTPTLSAEADLNNRFGGNTPYNKNQFLYFSESVPFPLKFFNQEAAEHSQSAKDVVIPVSVDGETIFLNNPKNIYTVSLVKSKILDASANISKELSDFLLEVYLQAGFEEGGEEFRYIGKDPKKAAMEFYTTDKDATQAIGAGLAEAGIQTEGFNCVRVTSIRSGVNDNILALVDPRSSKTFVEVIPGERNTYGFNDKAELVYAWTDGDKKYNAMLENLYDDKNYRTLVRGYSRLQDLTRNLKDPAEIKKIRDTIEQSPEIIEACREVGVANMEDGATIKEAFDSMKARDSQDASYLEFATKQGNLYVVSNDQVTIRASELLQEMKDEIAVNGASSALDEIASRFSDLTDAIKAGDEAKRQEIANELKPLLDEQMRARAQSATKQASPWLDLLKNANDVVEIYAFADQTGRDPAGDDPNNSDPMDEPMEQPKEQDPPDQEVEPRYDPSH